MSASLVVTGGHLGEGAFPSMAFPPVPQQVAALEEAHAQSHLRQETALKCLPSRTAFQSVPKADAISSKLRSKFSEGTLIRWLENAKWFNCCRK